jgi:anaerobic nitric oxide reductase transcription regulator
VVTVTRAHLDVAPASSPGDDVTTPAVADPGRTLREQIEAFERRVILDAVRAHAGNWAAAARALGMHRSNLHHRAARLGLRDT